MDLLKISDLHTAYDVNYPNKMDGLIIIDTLPLQIQPYLRSAQKFEGLILLFCKEGTAVLKVNNELCTVDQNKILIILPEMPIEPMDWSTDFVAVLFVMTYDFIDKFTILPEFINNTEVLNMPVIHPSEKDLLLIEDIVQLLQKHYVLPKTILLEQMIQYLVFSLITAVAQAYPTLSDKNNLQKNRVNDITDTFYNLLNKHGHIQRNVSFYAGHLHITPQHLSTLIKKKTGKSVKSWIEFAIINKAKEYLNNTSLSIKQISDELEFADASLFCRYFKRCTGQTPNTYKNR
ncbi:helix-turn-helix domain-containing protein [Sphingobacterium detergens]